jgi:hypothetical protein
MHFLAWARPGMTEDDPESDTATELDGNGKDRLRQGGDNVSVCADRLGHAVWGSESLTASSCRRLSGQLLPP